MFSLISIILIVAILIYFLLFKRKFIIRFLNKKKIKSQNNTIEKSHTKVYSSALKNRLPVLQDKTVYSHNERISLKRKMQELFKGSKEDKVQALKIAKQLSDKSTLNILRMGLKDMDSDIVEISASLIENFK